MLIFTHANEKIVCVVFLFFVMMDHIFKEKLD